MPKRKQKPKKLIKNTQKEPTAQGQNFKLKFPKLQLLKPLIIAFSILMFLLIPLLAVGSWYITSLSQASGLSPAQMYSAVSSGLETKLKSTNDATNVIILGTDEISGQKDGSLLTDTIILMSYDHNNNKLNTLSLPRDLWIDTFKTKINALYYYGEISNETTGKEFSSQVISEIIDLPIHYRFVIDLNSLESLISTLGGVEINVPKTFSDNKFPRSDIDINTATNEAQLFETITFDQGPQHMSGATALKYIRSRNSSNPDEGTDLARARRQQDLIFAIISKLKSTDVILNPHVIGSIYQIFRDQIETEELNNSEIIAAIRATRGKVPEFISHTLPVSQQERLGVIYHPPIEKHKQWVYEPVDPSWNQFATFVKQEVVTSRSNPPLD